MGMAPGISYNKAYVTKVWRGIIRSIENCHAGADRE